MVLGTTYYNAARSAAGTGWNHTRPLLAFRNACLATLALVAAVVAGDACSSPAEQPGPQKESAELELLPSPETVGELALPPVKEEGNKSSSLAANKPTSVVLPPIQSRPDVKDPAPPTPSRSAPSLPEPSSVLAEPPPSLGRLSKTEVNTNLELIVGQPRVMTFPDVPHRVALIVNENDPIASLREVPHQPREWYLIGKKPGLTYLDVWLPDPTNVTSHRVLHYRVRILSDVEARQQKIAEKPPAAKIQTIRPPAAKVQTQTVQREKPQTEKKLLEKPPAVKVQFEKAQPEKPRLEPTTLSPLYQTLEEEINRTFPGSSVHLKQVGEVLVVSGTAHNVFEATRILTLAREHAPGPKTTETGRVPPATPPLQFTLDNYAQAGGPHVVNLLRIPGEQQIMLRVVVAEVNRGAARSLGLDFGIADKQATILPQRPHGADGSPTVAANGWIGQLLRTLQDLHYAQSLAEPTLTTLNGQTARFQAGGEFPVPVVSPSANGAVQGVAFRSYGVHLSIQPVLADFDRIRLAVDAEVSGTDPQAALQVAGSAVPGLKVRNFQSTVELREGETLAVAGLIHTPAASTLPQNVRPGVGEQPAPDQELVVLISPLLLHPPANERGDNSNRLNPQDIELYLRSRNTMVPRGDALFLIGPQGYAGNRSQ